MPPRSGIWEVRLNIEVDWRAEACLSRVLPGCDRPVVILEYDAGFTKYHPAVDIASPNHVPSGPRILIDIEQTARCNDRSACQDVIMVRALEFPNRQNAAGVLEKNVGRAGDVEIVCGRDVPARARVGQIFLIKSAGRERIDAIAGALPKREIAVVVYPQKVVRRSGIAVG